MAHATTDGTYAARNVGLSIEVLEIWNLRALQRYNRTAKYSSSPTVHSSEIGSQRDSGNPDREHTDSEDDGNSDSSESPGSENLMREEYGSGTITEIITSDNQHMLDNNSSDNETYIQESGDSESGVADRDSEAEAEDDTQTVLTSDRSDKETNTQESGDGDSEVTDRDSDAEAEYEAGSVLKTQMDNRKLKAGSVLKRSWESKPQKWYTDWLDGKTNVAETKRVPFMNQVNASCCTETRRQDRHYTGG